MQTATKTANSANSANSAKPARRERATVKPAGANAKPADAKPADAKPAKAPTGNALLSAEALALRNAIVSTIYTGTSPVFHPSNKAPNKTVVADRCATPRHRIGNAGPTDRDISYCASVYAITGNAEHSITTDDIGVISRLSGSGYLVPGTESDKLRLTEAGRTLGLNGLCSASVNTAIANLSETTRSAFVASVREQIAAKRKAIADKANAK